MQGADYSHEASALSDAMLDSASSSFTQRLPPSPTPFVGRERQVADVCALMERPAVRLLTLTGPGGIGKTRLALAVAEALHSDFPDGVYYVSLAQLIDARLVIPVVAQALGAEEIVDSSEQTFLLERLGQFIGQSKLLLLLDNFEHLLDAWEGLAFLLGVCPHLKVLVTSRALLRLSAEYHYPVPPLTLPDLHNLPPLTFLAQVEAVRLFVARAQAVRPDFALTPANAMTVAAICHRLDGLPLAIELAAARARLLSPTDMLARLERSLALLTGGPTDSPPRHHTLRATIDWSYDLLQPHEQQLFQRLAVFAGGCTPQSVGEVCGGPQTSEEDLLHTLTSLLDNSLIRQEGGEIQSDRFYMLETLREYAMERLTAGHEAEPIRRAHALHFMTLAEEAEPRLVTNEQPGWLVRLEQEHDNIRAALTWALGANGSEGADAEIGARICAGYWRFWLIRGHLSEGRRWLETALRNAQSLPPALRARTLNAAGRLVLRQGDYTSAQAMLEESLALRRDLGDVRGEMQTLDNLGMVALYRNDLTQAQQRLEQSLAGWRSLDDKHGMANALNRLGVVLRYQGDFEQAAAYYQECLALAREQHDYFPTAAALHNLGQMAHHQGDDVTAHPLLVESLFMVRQMNDRPNISVALTDLAGVWATQGQPERAARLFGAAEALRENMRATMYEAQRIAYESDVARGAAQLDVEAWQAAWAEGKAMSLDDACALAAEPLPTASPDPPPPAIQASAPSSMLAARYDLSERELEVLHLLAAGLTYAEIADQLTLSFHTVHAHLRTIYAKLGVTSRAQATRLAIEQGLA
jgi:predicted ATPase/DNA-binding CsgD family transcriptional regulator